MLVTTLNRVGYNDVCLSPYDGSIEDPVDEVGSKVRLPIRDDSRRRICLHRSCIADELQ